MDYLPKLIPLFLLALILNLALFGGCRYHAKSVRKNFARELSREKMQWETDAEKREKERQKDIAKSYGSSREEQVYYNPATDLDTLVDFFAKKFAPENTKVIINRDRFVEYSVYLKWVVMPDADARVAYLKNLLTWVDARFLFQVAFVEEDGAVIVADQTCLLAFPDWSQALGSEIKRACFKP